MICSKCGQECADDMLFCTNCGAELSKEVQEEVAEAVAEVKEEATDITEEIKEAAEEVAAELEEVKEDVIQTAETVTEAQETVEETAETVTEAKEAVEETVKEKKGKKVKELASAVGKDGKKPTRIGLALVAILLLILIPAVTMNSGDDSYTKLSKDALLGIKECDGDVYACYLNGDRVKLDEEPQRYDGKYNTLISKDGSVAAYLNEDEELVIFADGEEIKTGFDEVDGLAVSAYGDTVAFFSDCESVQLDPGDDYWYSSTIRVGTLNLYDVKKKKHTEIAEEVFIGSAVLSPDGETVAYVAEYEAADDFMGFYSVDGKKPVEVGKEKRVFAIADKAKYIYYSDVERLYVRKKDKDEKLANEFYSARVLMNEDLSEMLYVDGGKTYITVKGGEKQKVSGSELYGVILDSDAAQASNYYSTENGGSVSVTYTGVDTFKEKLLYGGNQVHYMLNKLETEKLVSDVSGWVVAEDKESMVYLDGSNIMKITKFTKGGQKEKIVKVSGATRVYADNELKKIYVLTEKGDLNYIKRGKDVEIAEDVTSAVFSQDGDYFYFVEDRETLWYSKKGGKAKKIFTVDDGTLAVTYNSGVVYAKNYDDGETVWYQLDGKKAKELFVEEK